MEQKIKYQYTYFIYPYIIEGKKYNKYIQKLLRNSKCKLKVFDKVKDFDTYTYFLPKAREYLFWSFDLSNKKLKELKDMNNKLKGTILSKYPCTIFEYELEKSIQGKIGEENGIFFDIVKMEIICFNSGICFLTFKTVLNGENNLEDLLNFNYKFRDINSNLSDLREYENIKIQTNSFKDTEEFSNLIKEIAGNNTEAKKINLETERFITYSYVCLDQNIWENSIEAEVLQESFVNYANVMSAKAKTRNNIKSIEQKNFKYGFSSNSNVLMVSDINTDNYTRIPFGFENKYLYHYIFTLFKKIYLQKLMYKFNMCNNFEKVKEEFINFTKNVWIQEMTDEDLGLRIENNTKVALNIDTTFEKLKNKYDVLYKNYNIEKLTKGNNILVAIAAGFFIISLINFIKMIIK